MTKVVKTITKGQLETRDESILEYEDLVITEITKLECHLKKSSGYLSTGINKSRLRMWAES